MKYQTHGEGPLVVCFNGGGLGQWMWRTLIDRLPGHRVLTFDYAGFAGEEGTYVSIEHEVEKAKNLIRKEYRGGTVLLVGHSIGAQTVLKLMETADGFEIPCKALVISALNLPQPFMLKSTLPMMKLVMPLTKKRWFAKLNARSFRLPDDMFEAYYRDSSALDATWLVRLMTANMTFKTAKPSPERVRVMVGEQEIKLMVKSARLLSDAPILVAGAAHDIPYNHADVVVSHLHALSPGK